jgi:OOP family OmpA-OmpF porin
MTLKLSKLSLGIAASVVLLTAGSVYAQDKTFVQCSSGGPVRDSQGDCVIAAGGSALPDCLPAVAAAPAPAVLARSLDARVNFDFDKSNLRPEGMAELDRLVGDMSAISVQSVDVVGHTDSIGSEAYNQGLSERRAASAADYMITKGVASTLIATRGAGELQPIAPNRNEDGSDNPEGRAQNRRVDIAVVGEGN